MFRLRRPLSAANILAVYEAFAAPKHVCVCIRVCGACVRSGLLNGSSWQPYCEPHRMMFVPVFGTDNYAVAWICDFHGNLLGFVWCEEGLVHFGERCRGETRITEQDWATRATGNSGKVEHGWVSVCLSVCL